MVVALVIAPFLPEKSNQNGFAAPLWYVISVFLLFFGSLLLILLITLFNWPKWPVPPHLRDQPGAVHKWLRAKDAK
jgi:hypothetical protein